MVHNYGDCSDDGDNNKDSSYDDDDLDNEDISYDDNGGNYNNGNKIKIELI